MLLLPVLPLLLASCTGPDVPAAGMPMEGPERWECYDRALSSTPLVILTRAGLFGSKVQIAGRTYSAIFTFAGLDRRWNFGLDRDRLRVSYAFLVSPSGRGRYFDFTTADTAKPSQLFRCRLSH